MKKKIPKAELNFNWTMPQVTEVNVLEPDPSSHWPIIEHDDETPSVLEQAKAQGWDAAYYDFGKGEERDVHWFNPGLVETPDGLYLVARRSEPHPEKFQFGMNSVWACLLDDAGKVPRRCDKLKWPDSSHQEQFEDPRAAYHPSLNQVCITACNFIWNGNQWTGAAQILGFFDSEWECKAKHRPPIEGNARELSLENPIQHKDYQKNWVPFFIDGKLHIIYKNCPWNVMSFGKTWKDHKSYYHAEMVQWQYGAIRGGTPPILVDGLLWTFMHSSLGWKHRYRRYYAGAIAFEPAPPFRPVLITPEPLLQGSQNDEWAQRKPLVIFPCGSLFRDGKWLISCGVNDLKSAWVEIPHESLAKLMHPITSELAAEAVLPVSGLSKAEELKAKQRANAAKARAALAAKRNFSGVDSRTQRDKPETDADIGTLITSDASSVLATSAENSLHGAGEVNAGGQSAEPAPLQTKKKRRRRRTKRQMNLAARRLKAAQEFEASKV